MRIGLGDVNAVVAAVPAGWSLDDVRRSLTALAARTEAVAESRLVVERFPFSSHDARAHRLRNRLLSRPRAFGRRSSPAIEVLAFSDRNELAIVADPDVLDEAGVETLAAVLLGAMAAGDAPAARAAGDDAPETTDDARIELGWCDAPAARTNGESIVGVALSAEASRSAVDDDALTIAALAHALGRRTERPTVPIVIRRPRLGDGPRPGSSGAPQLVVVPVVPSSQVLAAAVAALAQARPAPAHYAVELRLPAGSRRDGAEFLARRFASPATLAVEIEALGAPRAVCHFDAAAVDDAAARDLVDDFAGALESLASGRDIAVPHGGTAAQQPGGVAAGLSASPRVLLDDDTIEQLVARQAARRPDAAAVSGPSGTLSYRALENRARLVANALRRAGVARGDRVGVCLARDAGLVAALLGVLEAGAAYVPLDPAYPQERLDATVADAAIGVVVAAAAERFPDRVTVVVDALGHCSGEARIPRVAASRAACSADAAYVIYTSGSTGVPKGVVVEHRNVCALTAACSALFELGPEDVWSVFHSAAFDFSVFELWVCLATGGHAVLVTDDVARDPHEFRSLLRARQVTVLSQTPSAFGNLLSAEREHAAELAVRLLVFGGEPLDARTLLPWFDRYPEDRCRVVNMFGITETTVHCTATTLTRRDALAGSRTVGAPLTGWDLRVLDAAGLPCPVGIEGEIYVGGAGVARGYLGRPGLTAQRFLPDPLGGGGRLYRSGDKGRFRRDETLEHLGRYDEQVKIRGYRIELGEIRHRLLGLPGVTAAAVVVNRRGPAGDTHIDAYVVAAQCGAGALRASLARVLPQYMLPSTITLVAALPLTANGKLDRAQLPPALEDLGPHADDVAETDDGSLLAFVLALWRDVLQSPIAADDNFFLVGGNSLLALRVSTRLKKHGFTGFSVRTIYANPTAEKLAQVLSSSDSRPRTAAST